MNKIQKISALALLFIGVGISTAAQAADRTLRVVNSSSYTIRELYVTNSDTNRWGRDWLGDGVIRPGYYRSFDFDDGTGACLFDLKVIMMDGRKVTRFNYNICRQEKWEIVD